MTHLFCFKYCRMIISVDFVKSKFDEFNQQMFDGKLSSLPIKLSSARTYLGQLRFRRKRKLFGGWKYCDFQLIISNKIQIEKQVVEDTILHEMIHYSILSNQLMDSSSHGKLFRSKMLDLNQRFKRNISIRHRFTKEEQDRDVEHRLHYICVSKFIDGKLGITIAAHARLLYLWDALFAIPKISETDWFVSHNPFFNRFPRSLKPKVYKITEKDLRDNLADAYRLRRVGDKIYIIK